MADSRAGAGIIQDQSGPFNEAKSKELWGGKNHTKQTNKRQTERKGWEDVQGTPGANSSGQSWNN